MDHEDLFDGQAGTPRHRKDLIDKICATKRIGLHKNERKLLLALYAAGPVGLSHDQLQKWAEANQIATSNKETLRAWPSKVGIALKEFAQSTEGKAQFLKCRYHDTRHESGSYGIFFDEQSLEVKYGVAQSPDMLPNGDAHHSKFPAMSLRGMFWKAHIESGAEKKVPIYISRPTFFRNLKTGIAIRHTSVNARGKSPSEAIEALKRHNTLSESQEKRDEIIDPQELKSTDLYLLRGEVEARDILARCFAEEHGLSAEIERLDCRGVAHNEAPFRSSSAVLLGSPRTSALVWEIFQHESEKLPFQVTLDGDVTVKKSLISPKELNRLPVLREAIGVDQAEKSEKRYSFEQDRSHGASYAVVTRIPNPWGNTGILTLVSCDLALSLPVIMEMLTNNTALAMYRSLIDLLEKKQLDRFQLLIRVGPEDGNPESKAELIYCWDGSSSRSRKKITAPHNW